MYQPQLQDEQPKVNTTSHENHSKNTFIQLFHWLLQQAYDNRAMFADLMYFLVTMYSLSLMIRPVSAAKTTDTTDEKPIVEYNEPYCESQPITGKNYCYQRNAKVYRRNGNRVETKYTYNNQFNNIGNPNFINDPRFAGRQPVFAQNPVLQQAPMNEHQHQGHFDPMNMNNFFMGGGRPQGENPLDRNVNQHQQHGNNDFLNNANERLRNANRR